MKSPIRYFGGKGGMSITNTGQDVMKVDTLPQNISGHIRSISIISHSVGRSGEIKDFVDSETGFSSEDGKDAVIITDRGDVIAAGLTPGQINPANKNSYIEPFGNIINSVQFTEIFVFYLCLIILIIYLFSDSRKF